jgi:hypothetical protein
LSSAGLQITREARRLLEHARELIADPDHWTKGAFARDALGEWVGIHNPKACRFCAGAALFRIELEQPEALSNWRGAGVPLSARLIVAFAALARAFTKSVIPTLLDSIEEPGIGGQQRSEFMRAIHSVNPVELVFIGNDLRAVVHADILRAFDEAIKQCTDDREREAR